MKGKHLKIKKVVIPFLTLAMLCGFTGNAFASGITVGISDTAQEVAVVTDITDRGSSGGSVQSDLTPQERVRANVMGIFGISSTNFGENRGSLYMDENGNAVQNATLYTALKNPEVRKIKENSKDRLIEISESVYPDAKGHWASQYIPLATYFGVMSGYDDGTVRLDNPVSVSEVSKIISTAYEYGLEIGSGAWYSTFYKASERAFTYEGLRVDGSEDYFNSPMKRCEIAYVLANYISGNSGELESYITNAKQGNISNLTQAFTDCNNLATDDDSTLQKDQELISLGYIPSRFAGALSYLVDKGVMVGTDEADGRHLNPTANVSRAETFILIEKACIATDSYTAGQFKGSSGTATGAGSQTSSGTETGTGTGSQTSTGTETGTSSGTATGSTGGIEIGIGSGSTGSTSTGSTGSSGSTVRSDLENPSWTYGESWEHYQSRENIKVYWNDSTRPRLKPGDTFVAEDGTEYVLELGTSGVLGEGLPIATDLGRMDEGGNVVTHGWQANTKAFGWIREGDSTGGRTYTVYRTGEGHWDLEWRAIQRNTRPQFEGEQGQWTDDGYWVCNNHQWIFAPLNQGVFNIL